MAITIELTDLLIRKIDLDYERNIVEVYYDRVDASGRTWDSGYAIFWAVMPPQTPIYDGETIVGYEPYPSSWFQLPETYFPLLLGLRDDADVALTAAFLT